MHARVVQLEQEKRDLKRELQEQRIQSSDQLRKESSSYSIRLHELRTENQKLSTQLDMALLKREEWSQELKEEHRLKLEELKMDMEEVKEENRKLSMENKELKRDEIVRRRFYWSLSNIGVPEGFVNLFRRE